MLIFKRGQPALLYLVPGCLGSVIACAFVRKEIGQVYNYDGEKELEEVLEATHKH